MKRNNYITYNLIIKLHTITYMFDCIQCKLKYAILTNNLCIFCNICKINNKDDIFNIIMIL